MAKAPGKGVHVPMTDKIVEFVTDALERVADTLEERDSNDPKEVLDELNAMGWVREKDKFGDKAYLAYELNSGSTELRVTAVNTNRGFMLDIRTWFEPA